MLFPSAPEALKPFVQLSRMPCRKRSTWGLLTRAGAGCQVGATSDHTPHFAVSTFLQSWVPAI